MANVDLEIALDWRPHTLSFKGSTYEFPADPPTDFVLGYPAFLARVRATGELKDLLEILAAEVPGGEAFRRMGAAGLGPATIKFAFQWLMHQWGLANFDPEAEADPLAEAMRIIQSSLLKALDLLLGATVDDERKPMLETLTAQIKEQIADVATTLSGEVPKAPSRAVRRASARQPAKPKALKAVPAPVAKARAKSSASPPRTSKRAG